MGTNTFSPGGQRNGPSVRDGSFDATLCLGALEDVLDESEAMDEMLRVLKPEGVLIVSMLNKKSPFPAWESGVY